MTDIHAASDPLQLALTAARREGFDRMLILGDLLTYGVQPLETLELVQGAAARDGAILISGNHDILYQGSPAAEAYHAELPDWLRESVDWTAAHIPPGCMTAFDWRESWSHGPLFAAHANPFDFGDWRYIRSVQEAEEAAATVAARGFLYGLFGHVHRHRRYDCAAATIFTLAALGQPRDDGDRTPKWAMIEIRGESVTIESRDIDFDPEDQMLAIRATTLSAATQERLCRFFA
ncbi:metallophosphoesterase [Sphingobium sp. JS3065]|uniref:metallophosphoesterase family protein n=1 Tax=Sphingobium sp. JS3065 TaxID=2970925 RepID=UPI0022655EA3|nr:metallophosphoesterase family protein [Sphingobium sp. JS3065]UZW54534.1 metallophosphoesterase [Sphingobium sp. JS3065]